MKLRKYLQILHESTFDNYFIIKCFLKQNMVKVFLLCCLSYRASLTQRNNDLEQRIEAKTASNCQSCQNRRGG